MSDLDGYKLKYEKTRRRKLNTKTNQAKWAKAKE